MPSEPKDVNDTPYAIDVISVGDTVIDDFIRLFEDQGRVTDEGQGQRWLGVPYGMKVPFEKSTVIYGVGNAANAAVNFAKLGLNSALATNLGNDQRGRQVVTELQKKGVDTFLIKLQHGKNTNYHYVLWYKDDRTILINHEHYDYHWPHLHKSEVPKWLYFSSIAENAVDMHDDIMEWLERHPEVKLAFQPGTYQIKFGKERLKHVYQRSDVVALNREEAVQVTGGSYDNLHELIDKLHELGPKIVLISDGHNGSYASDGNQRLYMPIYPDVAPPVERTGCGDAYTSTFVGALIKGYSLEGALQLAPITPASVVLYPGAQQGLLTARELKEWLEKAPASYKAERMK
ncbi:MAG: carbohydrate kinase family protein [Candidatus Saccharimonadales bacterium]